MKSLLDGPLAAGPQLVTWSGRDDDGRAVPAGVFFLRIDAAPYSAVRKVLLIR